MPGLLLVQGPPVVLDDVQHRQGQGDEGAAHQQLHAKIVVNKAWGQWGHRHGGREAEAQAEAQAAGTEAKAQAQAQAEADSGEVCWSRADHSDGARGVGR